MKTAKEIMDKEYKVLYDDQLDSLMRLNDMREVEDRDYTICDVLYNDSEYDLYLSIPHYSYITMLMPKSFNPMDSANEDVIVIHKGPSGLEFTKYSFLGNNIEAIKYIMKIDGDVNSSEEKKSFNYSMTKVLKNYSFDEKDLKEYVEKVGDSFKEAIMGDFWNDFGFYAFLNSHLDSEVKTDVLREELGTTGEIHTRIMDAVIPSTGFLATDMESFHKCYDYDCDTIEDNDSTLYELVNNLSFNNNKSK